MLDLNEMNDQEIHNVAKSGNLSELQRLIISNKKLILANGWFGMKPLHYAAQSGNLECVKFLVTQGAGVNIKCIENRSTPIFEASTEAIAIFLHKNGADLNVITSRGRIPLDYAIQRKHVDVVKYFVKSGVDVNFKEGPKFYLTMLQWAINDLRLNDEKVGIEKDIQASLKICEILLEAGADPNQGNGFGVTALHTAVKSKLKQFVVLLLKYHADPCIRDENGMSCFDYTKDETILELLEPYKVNLVEKIKVQDSFEILIKRLVATRVCNKSEFRPCREQEIKDIEKTHNVILPEEYKRFLRTMGNGAGTFLKNDHWDIFLPSLNYNLGKYFFEFEEGDLENGEPPYIQPENFFVFASRLGESNLGFFADGTTSDPIIYEIEEKGKLKKRFETIWGFIQEMVEYYEYYSKPEKFRSPLYEPLSENSEKKKWWEFWR